jgi:hypothetical protein
MQGAFEVWGVIAKSNMSLEELNKLHELLTDELHFRHNTRYKAFSRIALPRGNRVLPIDATYLHKKITDCKMPPDEIRNLIERLKSELNSNAAIREAKKPRGEIRRI